MVRRLTQFILGKTDNDKTTVDIRNDAGAKITADELEALQSALGIDTTPDAGGGGNTDQRILMTGATRNGVPTNGSSIFRAGSTWAGANQSLTLEANSTWKVDAYSYLTGTGTAYGLTLGFTGLDELLLESRFNPDNKAEKILTPPATEGVIPGYVTSLTAATWVSGEGISNSLKGFLHIGGSGGTLTLNFASVTSITNMVIPKGCYLAVTKVS